MRIYVHVDCCFETYETPKIFDVTRKMTGGIFISCQALPYWHLEDLMNLIYPKLRIVEKEYFGVFLEDKEFKRKWVRYLSNPK